MPICAADVGLIVFGLGRPRVRCSYPPKTNSLSLMSAPPELAAKSLSVMFAEGLFAASKIVRALASVGLPM